MLKNKEKNKIKIIFESFLTKLEVDININRKFFTHNSHL